MPLETAAPETEDLADKFGELIEQHGDAAVQQLVVGAYSDEIAGELAKSAPGPDLAAIEQRVGVVERLLAKLVDDPQSLAKGGPGQLSDADKRSVAAMAAGF